MPLYSEDFQDILLNEKPQEQTEVNLSQQTPLIVNSGAVRNVSRLRADSEDDSPLQDQIQELEGKEKELTALLCDMDKAAKQKRAPVENERESVAEERRMLKTRLAFETEPNSDYPPAPGPRNLKFVDSHWFGAVCNIVVVLNLACMALKNKLEEYHTLWYVLDQLFMVWYVFELAAKWKYHRCHLFFGNFYVVWWNWLDAGIVIGGVVDQWVMGLVQLLGLVQLSTNASMVRSLRLLRLFRLARFLKVIKAFVHFDSLAEQAWFQLFMSAVIAVNSMVLALELDIDWAGWVYFEQLFLIVYLFELSLRLKAAGWHFFVNSDLTWNNLDFIMVCGGIFDLWLMPAWSLIVAELYGETKENSSVTSTLKMLKMMKVVRVLRLVRLLRSVKYLHSLLVGISEAMAAMRQVMVLALLVLYSSALTFTSMIGHGYLHPGRTEIPYPATKYFGHFSSSLFSLFMLMNGDTAVVGEVTDGVSEAMMFTGFVVLSNWAVLAILTSVISDKMISSSQRAVQEDRDREEAERLESRARRLAKFFTQMDTNKNRVISRFEWDQMLMVPELREELCDTSGLDEATLMDVFACLADESEELGEFIRYEDFIIHLNHDKDVPNRRQVLHLSHLMKDVQKTTLLKVENLKNDVDSNFEMVEGRLGKAIEAVKNIYHQEANGEAQTALNRIDMLENRTQQKFEVVEGMLRQVQGMLEKVTQDVNQKRVRDPSPVPRDMESRFVKLEDTITRKLEDKITRKLEVLEKKFDNSTLAANPKPLQEDGPRVSNEMERRIGRLEDAAAQKFDVLENMLEKVMEAVTQIRRM